MNRHEYRVKIIFSVYQSLLLKKDLQDSFNNNFDEDINEFMLSIKDDLKVNLNNYINEIEPHLVKWTFDRLSYLEQAILLVATSEIRQNLNDKKVVIDEAINITKEYCDEESYKYINGVLDNL